MSIVPWIITLINLIINLLKLLRLLKQPQPVTI